MSMQRYAQDGSYLATVKLKGDPFDHVFPWRKATYDWPEAPTVLESIFWYWVCLPPVKVFRFLFRRQTESSASAD